jgi:hypothetical protein
MTCAALSNTIAVVFELARCIVFDVEVYPDRWCVGFRGIGSDGSERTKIIDGNREELWRLLQVLADQGWILVGFNSAHFDVPVIRVILGGYDPFPVAQSIIAGEDLSGWVRTLPAFPWDHIDLSARVRRGGRFPSLKLIAANLGRPVLQDLPYAPGSTLSDAEWEEVKRYNAIDLGHTWELLRWFGPELQALAALSCEQGRDLRSIPTPQVVERVFQAAYRREHGGCDPVKPVVPLEVVYRPVAGVVRPATSGAAEWFDRVANQPLPVVNRGERVAVDVPRAKFTIGKLSLSPGAGGLHSIDSPGVYYASRKRRLVSIDVASFYPTLIATKGISPAAYGTMGNGTFRAILDRRLELKNQARHAEDAAERERLEVQATALKLVLNSFFGKLGDSWSTLFDPGAFIAVTLSGQLMLLDLIERLTLIRVPVLSANTDGIFIAPRRDDGRWREVVSEWQADTGMALEVESLRRLAILANNRIATLDRAGKIKRRGSGVKGLLFPLAAPNQLIVSDAVVGALLEDIPPERTIEECTDPVRFCAVARKSGKVLSAVLFDEATGAEVKLGRVTRWYKARGSRRKIVHRFDGGRHTTPNHATGVNLALDVSSGLLPADLDRSWYKAEARKVVQGMPGYRHRSRRLVEGDERASKVLSLGLLPVPKDGKWQPAGSDAKRPTLLWHWGRYPTIGTYTGPAVGLLVLDVDDAKLFRRSVDKGNFPLLADRWNDLRHCLVSCHGDVTGEAVRIGQGRGKLILRVSAAQAGAIDSIAVGHWKKSRGVEVFFGKGLPSILGHYGAGDHYRLEGSLGEAPEWLIEWLTPKKRSRKPEPSANGHAAELAPEVLEGIPLDLAELAPELGSSAVGWRSKPLGDGGSLWIGRCPFPHESGSSSDGDLSAGVNGDGLPYVKCMHSSCVAIPEINLRLKDHYRAKLKPIAAEVGILELTAIARGIVEDLAGGLTVLHKAPTGAGKTYGIAQAAVIRARGGKRTAIALPTVRLCEEVKSRIREFAPSLFAGGSVTQIGGTNRGSAPDDEDEGSDDEAHAVFEVSDSTLIVICTHQQLMRRGFSRFLRALWGMLGSRSEEEGGESVSAFALIVDEVAAFIQQSRRAIALAHRYRMTEPRHSSVITFEPRRQCPKFSGSGNCANCWLQAGGGELRRNMYSMVEIVNPRRVWFKQDRRLCESAYPLDVDERQFVFGEEARIGITAWAKLVTSYRGIPVGSETIRTADAFIYEGQTGRRKAWRMSCATCWLSRSTLPWSRSTRSTPMGGRFRRLNSRGRSHSRKERDQPRKPSGARTSPFPRERARLRFCNSPMPPAWR